MLSVTATKLLPAAPERVWEIVSDTTRYAEWVDGTAAVTRSDGPARVGSTYDEINPVAGPWKARTHWEVVECDAPRRQVHRSADLPLASRFDVIMELEPEGDGTRFTMSLEGEPSHGPVGAAFTKLMSGMVDKDNRSTVDNLEALVRREVTVAA